MRHVNVTEKTANFVFSRAYDVPVNNKHSYLSNYTWLTAPVLLKHAKTG